MVTLNFLLGFPQHLHVLLLHGKKLHKNTSVFEGMAILTCRPFHSNVRQYENVANTACNLVFVEKRLEFEFTHKYTVPLESI